MKYQIVFFNAKVQAAIAGWPVGVNASFVRIAEAMEVSGPNLGMPYTRPFGDGLFEIRAKGQEGIGRAFFCCTVGRRVVILHSFIKKIQATPAKEMAVAWQRLKEVKRNGL